MERITKFRYLASPNLEEKLKNILWEFRSTSRNINREPINEAIDIINVDIEQLKKR